MFSKRSFGRLEWAASWEDIWEAGLYFQRISELLEDAKEYAVFVGWQIDSRLPMLRISQRTGIPDPSLGNESLKNKILRICEEKKNFHFYILMWDHAYFYSFERELLQGRVWDDIHDRVHFVFDNRHPFGTAHHEKIVIIDGKIALCGGVDLCAERWDTPLHLYTDPRRSLNWKTEHHGPFHDLSVQVTGPVCSSILAHIGQRWSHISNIPFPKCDEKYFSKIRGGHQVYISRTIANIDAGQRGSPITREIEFLLRDLIRNVKRRLILEGQYYWSHLLNDSLISKMKQMKGKNFQVYLFLTDLTKMKSLTRYMSFFQLSLLQKLQEAAKEYDTKLFIGYPYSYPQDLYPHDPKPIYVHSKIVIVDNTFLSIGSANFASRAFRSDTELNLTLSAQNQAEMSYIDRFSRKVLNHWNVKNESSSHVRIHRVRAKLKNKEMSRKNRIISKLPWHLLFDPIVPWFYLAKWKIRKIERKHPYQLILFLSVIAIIGCVLSALIAGVTSWSESLYIIALSAVWLIPVPFTLVVIIAIIDVGPFRAAEMTVASLWIAGIIGYIFNRICPSLAERFYGGNITKKLRAALHQRKFSEVINVVFDPRLPLHNKIYFQGHYFIPFPWFLIINILVLPSAYYTFCLLIGLFIPKSW